MIRKPWSKTLSTRYNTGNGSVTDGAILSGDIDTSKKLTKFIIGVLEENSGQEILNIDLEGKSSIADYMVVASGRSNRHVNALADYVQKALKEAGLTKMGIEGQESSDWVLIDAGDVICHIFRPEVREFYNIEKIWTSPVGEGHLSSSTPLQPIAE